MSNPLESPVFSDPSGRRARRLTVAGGAVTVVLVGLLVAFLVSVLVPPRLPSNLRARRFRPAGLPAPDPRDLAYSRQKERPIGSSAAPVKGRREVGAYLPTWAPAALPSFETNARRITTVYPTFLTLNSAGAIVPETSATPAAIRRVTETARNAGVSIEPIVSNASGGDFDPRGVQSLLRDPKIGDAAITRLASGIRSEGWAGVQVDFENLGDADMPHLATWMGRLKRAIGTARLSVAAEPSLSPKALRALSASADTVVAMAYDEHEDQSEPGPIASQGYVRATLEGMLAVIPREKLVLGIGTYGYDWTLPYREDRDDRAESMTYEEAVAAAAGYRDDERPSDVMRFDPVSRNSTFEYRDDEDRAHVVWLQDAASAYNAVRDAAPLGIRGVAIWSLGGEDPGIWSVVGRNEPTAADLNAARETKTLTEVTTTGAGEVLRVEKEASPGRRDFRLDPDGFIRNVVTDVFPTGTVVHQSGALKGAVALTFDDGPDPTWTPRILDILKANGVPATFFVIGESAAREPGLVRRMEDEGHDVGSHSFSHPNLGVVGPERVRLELDGAQRAIQAATGRSTILFRPPYNADSTPQTQVELSPVAAATRLGYLTVGESVDPEDWLLRAPDGRGRTAEEMAAEIIRGVERGGSSDGPVPGAAILLHDGGGDRSRTLDVLKIVIPRLKAKGYRFVTTGGLLGFSHDRTMPPLTGRQRIVALMDSVSFRLSSAFERGLGIAFATAIVLGVLRAVLIAALAIIHRRRLARTPVTAYTPPVEVLVAAYNEEKTIARTIASLLASDYPDLGILVIDDGSKDDTAGVVEREFGDDPRVRLVRKPNGGKASALNLALSKAVAPIVVGVDADTQLPVDAIRRLVAPLADPEIGMTAGNVKVGNVHNAVTTWQDVEYTTSQNLDRRAYALLNCVTVVPGAIGAWRRDAVRAVGGYQTDTLAEDMDLTWRLRQAGWRAETVPDARAYTEAPETVRAFLKQRFRWTFGTLQCLWKHRAAVGRYGWFGGFALPSLWIFQIALQVIAPLVDLQIAWSLVAAIVAFADPVPKAYLREWNPQGDAVTSLVLVLASAGAFVLIEAITGLIAYRMDRESPQPLLWLPLQRFVYRQVMYLVVWSALRAAFLGARHGWGKLERTARVRLGTSG